ncbi:MAG: AbrB family transcriptional regulator [Actinobacteria bacterium]|nr:AbrB family transcriptional regulator [Actinomycetota bacterium]
MSQATPRGKRPLTVSSYRAAAHVREGDRLEAQVTDEDLALAPPGVIDAAQAWFWSAAWQKGERAASADLAAGRIETPGSGDRLVEQLQSIAKPARQPRRR